MRRVFVGAAAGGLLVLGATLSNLSSASAPQPNVVRLVRVGEGRWEGTACWPHDGGVLPHCFKTQMTGWEPSRVDSVEEVTPKFVDGGVR